ncbi:MAG: EAL domain-containing protein [Leptolyngbya sp. SIO1D8]|nr:EAL domain-containing protein [Leptolyngbya sp. SIO1D8]
MSSQGHLAIFFYTTSRHIYQGIMNTKRLLIFKDKNNVLVEVLEKKIYTVGRCSSDDIFLSSREVSRGHATIYFLDNSFWIIDGDLKGRTSTNGILINEARVYVQKLHQYDIITFCKGIEAIFIEYEGDPQSSHVLEELIKNITIFFSGKDVKEVKFSDSKTEVRTLASQFQKSQLDDLTNLPNRSAFLARVRKSLEFKRKIAEEHQFSILFIDVDRFKMVNDSLGHLAGDQFLIQLAERFKTCLRPGDMVARLGGDEFAILLDDIDNLNEATSVAKRLQKDVAKPLQLEKQEVYPSISIGIASSYLQYQTVEEVLRDADIAMYNAKKTGRARFVVFDEKMHQKASELLKLDGDLRKAIDYQQLQLYYQPIVSLKEKILIGFEALIRWNHPELGLVNPDTFIPIAEETNLIYQLGIWILNEACQQLKIWKHNALIKSDLSISINISSKQLSDTRLIKSIERILQKYEIKPGELKLELTESIAMEDSQHTIKFANELKQIGVPLVVDDFGTGYSSLSYLNRFPIDTLKIDRSFVSNMDIPNENTSLNITNSIISLAHSLGVKVVAEGIEKAYHLAYLKQMRCDYGQGYLFSEPLDALSATDLAQKGLDWPWKF